MYGKRLALIGGLALLGIYAAYGQQVPAPAPASICAFNSILPTLLPGNFGFTQCDSLGRVLNSPGAAGAAGFPISATPITGNATGSTSAVVGTLAAAAGKFTYICGFNVSAIGGTAAVGPITVAGLVGSSQVYQASSTAAGGIAASATFTPCIPSSAVNTAITTTTTADGTATAVDVNSWGYQQ